MYVMTGAATPSDESVLYRCTRPTPPSIEGMSSLFNRILGGSESLECDGKIEEWKVVEA